MTDLSETEILLELLQGKKGDEWAKERKGWNEKTFVCQWDGIKCDAHNVVTEINLEGQGLIATIPDNLGLMSGLQHLFLGDNNLYGTVPDIVIGLTKLVQIDLSSNKFRGTIPMIENANLEAVTLSNNQFSGKLPVNFGHGLKKLKLLSVQNNKIGGTLPDSLQLMKSLVQLDLSNNNFAGPIPETLGKLSHLEALVMSNNKFIGTLPPSLIGDILSLKELVFHGNFLSGTLPASLADLPNLEILFIDGNKFTGSVPQELCAKNLNEAFFGNSDSTMSDNFYDGDVKNDDNNETAFDNVGEFEDDITLDDFEGVDDFFKDSKELLEDDIYKTDMIPDEISYLNNEVLNIIEDIEEATAMIKSGEDTSEEFKEIMEEISGIEDEIEYVEDEVEEELDNLEAEAKDNSLTGKDENIESDIVQNIVNVDIGEVYEQINALEKDMEDIQEEVGEEVDIQTLENELDSIEEMIDEMDDVDITHSKGGGGRRNILSKSIKQKNTRNGCNSIACPPGTMSSRTASKDGVFPCVKCEHDYLNPYLGAHSCHELNHDKILSQFFYSTDGKNWLDDKHSWIDVNITTCHKQGITCDSNGNIIAIFLSNMHLSGTISEDIGFLRHLEILDLSDNSLYGNIPSELKFLPLELLDLSGNMLTGFVPPKLCKKNNINGNENNTNSDCSTIACGVGTYSKTGNSIKDAGGCIPCADNNYLASKTCSPLLLESPDTTGTKDGLLFSVSVLILFVVAGLGILVYKVAKIALRKKHHNVYSTRGTAYDEGVSLAVQDDYNLPVSYISNNMPPPADPYHTGTFPGILGEREGEYMIS